MEFWGVEVKAGEKLKVQPEFGQIIHISQASLGEVKDAKGSKNIPLRMKIDNKNFVIGTLSAEDRPQVIFDLVFEKEFELSHDWKNGSIYFMGYVADDSVSDGEEFPSDDDESEDELASKAPENGFSKAKAEIVKPTENDVAAKVGAKDEAKKEEDSDDDDSESDSDDEMALDEIPEIDSSDVAEDDSDNEDDDDEIEEELPKVQQSKKRPAGSAEKTPVLKKAKSSTPDKSGKKGQNVTPAPSKATGKISNKSDKTPKSGGQVSCISCSKTFNSENAMQSHAKAKHGGK